jgi:hypothetical protein
MGLKIAVKDFLTEWGIDPTVRSGGLDQAREIPEERREVLVTDLLMIDSSSHPSKVYLLQRRSGKFGAGLGKTTGRTLLHLNLSPLTLSICPFLTSRLDSSHDSPTARSQTALKL